MYDAMGVIEIREPLEHSQAHLSNNNNRDRTVLSINVIQTPLVHKFHAYAYMGLRDERAVEGYDVWGVAIVHDLEFSQNLFPNRGFRVDQDNLRR